MRGNKRASNKSVPPHQKYDIQVTEVLVDNSEAYHIAAKTGKGRIVNAEKSKLNALIAINGDAKNICEQILRAA